MTANGLRPYPAYRESGVRWLGTVPDHWCLVRAKRLFTKMDRPVRPNDEVVTCFRDGTVTLRKNRRELGFTESLKEIGYQGVRRGDLVIHAMDAFAGACGVSDSDGKSTPVYSVCTPTKDEGANSRYYASCVREMARSRWITALSRGVRERSTDFRFAAFRDQLVPVPSSREQRAIVRYLDAADRRIRRYILARERLIELLEERKRAVIHEAVTGRIDVRTGQLYPAYKDSGVEWLGRVPEHWEVRRLGATTEPLVAGTWGSDPTGRDDIVCVRVADFDRRRLGVNLRKPTLRSVPAGERQRRLLEPGDLLLEKSGGGDLQPVGAVVRFDHDQEAVASNFIGRMRVRRQHSARYVLYLNSVLYAIRLTVRSIKQTTGIQNLDVGAYLSEFVPLPPLPEQTAVARFLDDSDRCIRRHISATEWQIALLHEYRARLIADVVTGKLDVREATARVPETDPLADDCDRADTIATESILHSAAHDIAKEASA